MTSPADPRPRSKRRLGVWLGYWLGLFVITHLPVKGMGRFSFDYADKIIHWLLYFFLAWLGGRSLFVKGLPPSITSLVGWAGIYALYAAFDEWLQQFVGRTMSLSDWLANALGIAVATLWLLHRRSATTRQTPLEVG